VKRITLACWLVAFVGGCVHMSQMTLPDGSSGYIVKCDNENVDRCYHAATNQCGGRYHMVNWVLAGNAYQMTFDCPAVGAPTQAVEPPPTNKGCATDADCSTGFECWAQKNKCVVK
jgi:hypothetical protein